MGLFYTNITLQTVEQDQVFRFLCREKRAAYISPVSDNYLVVYDKDTEDQDENELKNLASLLSKSLACSALASLVHDSDIYCYWLFRNGPLVDSYDSNPRYFDAVIYENFPEGGDAGKLCSAFGMPDRSKEVRSVFEKVEKGISNMDYSADYPQGEDIHDALAKILGMPSFAVSTGFYTLQEGGYDLDGFIKTI